MVRSRHRSRKPVEKQNVPVKLSTEPEGAGKVETSVSRSSAALLGRYALVSYCFFLVNSFRAQLVVYESIDLYPLVRDFPSQMKA
jgi:hypothetical protein